MGSLAAVTILVSYQNCGPGFNVALEESRIVQAASETPMDKVSCEIGTSPANSLDETCLGAVLKTGVKYTNLQEYTPQYPLFSDSATKRRWIYLPENSKIDNSNPDEWIFPIGTILWKEFSLGPNKIETRQTEKISATEWRFSVYLWSRDQKTASRVDTLPTNEDFAYFDVKSKYAAPPVGQCITCHAGSTDKVLGFSYLQLSRSDSSFGVNQLIQNQWLTQPTSDLDQIQSRTGDNGLQARALGYLQGNCSSCHNSKNASLPNFRHAFGAANADDEKALQSLLARGLVNLADPNSSMILGRMNSDTRPMPPRFAHMTLDQNGVTLIQQWLGALASSITPPSTTMILPPPPTQPPGQ